MLQYTDLFGVRHDKVNIAMERIRNFCPDEGYYVAFSGGKDSQCIYHLCKLAMVPFDAHYNVTSVDPPELIRFIKEQYPDVIFDIPRYKDGLPITMWNLIPRKLMPPTRTVRYCCAKFKESGGVGRVTMTGVRWAESQNRRNNQGVVTFPSASKRLRTKAEETGANFTQTVRGGGVLNDDNDMSRRMVEQCYRTSKTLVNPIVDWEDEDVWEFLNEIVGVPHCKLYDEGLTRIGCIGCPMGHNEWELQRWPKYRENYMRAFERMIAERERRGINAPPTRFENAQDVMDWWLGKKRAVKNQMSIFDMMDIYEED